MFCHSQLLSQCSEHITSVAVKLHSSSTPPCSLCYFACFVCFVYKHANQHIFSTNTQSHTVTHRNTHDVTHTNHTHIISHWSLVIGHWSLHIFILCALYVGQLFMHPDTHCHMHTHLNHSHAQEIHHTNMQAPITSSTWINVLCSTLNTTYASSSYILCISNKSHCNYYQHIGRVYKNQSFCLGGVSFP